MISPAEIGCFRRENSLVFGDSCGFVFDTGLINTKKGDALQYISLNINLIDLNLASRFFSGTPFVLPY